MAERSDAEVVERFHAALLRNDAPALRDVLAGDVEWHGSGRSPIGGSHRGPDAVIGLVGRLHERAGGTLRPLRDDSHDIMVSDYHAMLIDRFLAEREGKRLDAHVGFVVVTEGGHVKLVLPYFSDQYAWDEFFG